ncbi:uncharacterized protein LOC124619270 [Schistocerca americana]|uniref:uncharacterized protein LOC124619270 n=1 Tax=Schistocerca americana TaxID=7009 RepID=UPI001F500851|nr:uncharacterized protein LOC124619270 [Schistocerca americana]
MVGPIIKKGNTAMREAISSQSLPIMLRYLVTRNSFKDLKFTRAVSPQKFYRHSYGNMSCNKHALMDYIWLYGTYEFEIKWNFPYCLSTIGGKHHFFSIVVLRVVNANCELLMVDVGMNYHTSYGSVLYYSKFGDLLGLNHLNVPAGE